ncbi:hypothetical protein IFR04_009188 [Cadophora malorum]|uniref:Uncharacterized protein n=1 Tax=Cadophora malorum TaxID=108018 RepID=A0A8H7W5A7_9HELO|nr:hypothetical protein IFR04_009188 [Cadophora malorum]
MSGTADKSVNNSDPLAIWGTPEWDQVLNMLCKLNEQSVETGHVRRDFNAINQLLNGLSFIIPKFKLVREIELRSGNEARMGMVATFLTPPYPPSSAP